MPINVARGNLGLSARGFFTPFIVTHVSIRTCDTSSKLLSSPSQAYTTLPYHANKLASAASVHHLAPVNLPRRPTRPVSYYAFFKGWLLLSQPPGCLGLSTSFPTEWWFWDLSWRSGLLPSWLWTLAPIVCLLWLHFTVFGVCHGTVGRCDPLAITVLYPRKWYIRHYLNSFRGEPAISELV